MQMHYDYKPQTAFANLHAAKANGWSRWSIDASGVQWFRRESYPKIQGVPAAAEMIEGDVDDEIADDIEAADATDERNLKRYHTIVELRAAGQDIDPVYGRDVLDSVGKTMAEFDHDVAEMIQLNAEIASYDS